MTFLMEMEYRLVIQPIDVNYDFLEDISLNSKVVYEIQIIEIASTIALPEQIFLKPKSVLAKFFMKGRKMVYLNDLLCELKRRFNIRPQTIFLAILPHYVLGFGESLFGLTAESNIAIVSTYGIDKKHLSEVGVGISLHEIGHCLGLKHCKVNGCLMKTPCQPKNFYEGSYTLCNEHQLEVKSL
jgi:predicted Zn-dependent protease